MELAAASAALGSFLASGNPSVMAVSSSRNDAEISHAPVAGATSCSDRGLNGVGESSSVGAVGVVNTGELDTHSRVSPLGLDPLPHAFSGAEGSEVGRPAATTQPCFTTTEHQNNNNNIY